MTPKVRPLLAALAAIFMIATQLASVGHYVLVAHYFCAEHGTLHEGRPEAGVASDDGSSARDTASTGASDEHGHEDCSYFSRGGDIAANIETAVSCVLPTGSVTALAVSHADAVVALATLTFAPKQSPPLSI